MNPELQALLVVQDDDTAIRHIEARLAALAPRLATLETIRRKTIAEVDKATGAIEREDAKSQQLQGRIADHRQRHERNVTVLNNAQKLKEATAAAAQVEAARRALAEEEAELSTVTRRLADLRSALATHQEALAQVVEEQATLRAAVADEQAAIEAELTTVRTRRARSAQAVNGALLARYERVQARRRADVVVALHADFSCGACDTAIPLQRRLAMATGTIVEPCEACGVLLYFVPAPAPAATS